MALAAPALSAAHQPAAPRGSDAVAVINEAAAGAKGTFPIAAPLSMPLKETAYPLPPGALFVSPQGKGNRPGTSCDAPTTLDSALKRAPEGGTVVFRGGTYRVGDLTLPRRLTLQAYPGEKPWLKGSTEVAGWVPDGNAWRRDNWQIKFPPRGYMATVLDKVTDPKYPMAPYGDMVFVNGRALFQVGSRRQVGPGKFYVDYAAQKLYIGDDPNGKTVEAATQERALTIGGPKLHAGGSSVRGLGFVHYQLGVNVAASRVVIEDCTFVWNANNGLNFGKPSADCIARGNTFTANGSTGMSALGTPRLRVERNLISYNNVEGFKRTWSAAGVKVVLFEGFVCRDNVVEQNFATGIWMDVDLNHAVVTGNLARFNNSIGIFFEISKDAVIAFNLVHDNGAGVQISGSHHARVYNNTLVNNNRNFVVQQGARKNTEKTGEVANTPPGEFFTARGNVFKNNILWNSRPGAKDALFDFTVWGQSPERRRAALMISASEHNAYHRVTPNQPPFLIRWASDGKELVGYDTIEAFTAATDYGKDSLSTTGDDPYFVDAVRGDFRLKPGSPAIGKGAAPPPDIAQATGKAATENIGAF
jgi:hypothetical protein